MKEVIYNLEMKLLDTNIRKDPEAVSDLVSGSFVEYCSSGKVYRYKHGDTFESAADDSIFYEIMNFTIKELSEDTVLALYTAVKRDLKNNTEEYSLRSSIWDNTGNRWKIIFHQGTKMIRSEHNS